MHSFITDEPQTCQRFYLFEPICTAFLLAAASGKFYFPFNLPLADCSQPFMLFGFMASMKRTAKCSVFLGVSLASRSLSQQSVALSTAVRRPVVLSPPPPDLATAVPLLEGQGCIAGPKHNWVGIYWLAPTLLYTASVSPLRHKATCRSFLSNRSSPWP